MLKFVTGDRCADAAHMSAYYEMVHFDNLPAQIREILNDVQFSAVDAYRIWASTGFCTKRAVAKVLAKINPVEIREAA
jgi:hypothetical protein